MPPKRLSPEEVENVSRLLMSELPDTVLLGYELLKRNRAHIDELKHELVLNLMLSDNRSLTRKLQPFLSKRYPEEYALWKEQFAIFNRISSVYSYSKELKEMLSKHEEIRAEFQPFVIQNRIFARRYYDIGRILQYRIEQEFELAEIYYEIVTAGDPGYYNAWFNLGHLCQNHLSNPAKSEKCYLEVIRLNPNMAAAHNNIGVLRVTEDEDPEAALPYYRKALELNPNYNFYKCNVASTELRLGNTLEFERLMQEVLTDDYDYQRAINQWANYLWEYKKDYKAAESEYKRGLKMYSNDPNLLGNLGEMYADVFNRYEDALKYYKRSLKANRSVYRLTTIVSMLANDMNKPKEALPYYVELLEMLEKSQKRRDYDLNDEQWESFLEAEKKLIDLL